MIKKERKEEGREGGKEGEKYCCILGIISMKSVLYINKLKCKKERSSGLCCSNLL